MAQRRSRIETGLPEIRRQKAWRLIEYQWQTASRCTKSSLISSQTPRAPGSEISATVGAPLLVSTLKVTQSVQYAARTPMLNTAPASDALQTASSASRTAGI